MSEFSIAMEDVPEGLIQELEGSTHKEVEFRLDHTITDDTITYRSTFEEEGPLRQACVAVNPVTFLTEQVTGYPTSHFTVRVRPDGEDRLIVSDVIRLEYFKHSN